MKFDDIRNYMKEVYARSLAMNTIAQIDGLYYSVNQYDKIILEGIDESYSDESLIINDIFDDFKRGCFSDLPRCVKHIIYDKTNEFCVDYLSNIQHPIKLEVTSSNDIYSIKICSDIIIKTLVLHNTDIIRDNSFRGSDVESVSLGRVHTIEKRAFGDCRSLKNINLSHVCYIDKLAFYNSKMEVVDLRNLECVLEDSFGGCENLKEITLSSKCQYVENGAFNLCSKLKKVNFIGSQEEWRSLSKNIHFWRNYKGEYGTWWNNNRIYVNYING